MLPTIYNLDAPIKAPCLILGMPQSVYHTQSPGISKSGLDRIALSPAHYRYAEPRDSTRHMEIGTAIHCALLEPARFAEDYLLLRDVPNRTCSEHKAAIKQRSSEFVLTGPESDHVVGMQETLYADPNTRKLLMAGGHREASLFVNDPETGVLVRVRFDIVGENGGIVDLKKTRDCRATLVDVNGSERTGPFTRSILEYRYHVQAALYMDAYEWATGQKSSGFAMLAVEDKMPHARAIWLPTDSMIERGRREYRRDLNLYAQCMAANEWPCYDSAPKYVELPDYLLDDEITTEDDAE